MRGLSPLIFLYSRTSGIMLVSPNMGIGPPSERGLSLLKMRKSVLFQMTLFLFSKLFAL